MAGKTEGDYFKHILKMKPLFGAKLCAYIVNIILEKVITIDDLQYHQDIYKKVSKLNDLSRTKNNDSNNQIILDFVLSRAVENINAVNAYITKHSLINYSDIKLYDYLDITLSKVMNPSSSFAGGGYKKPSTKKGTKSKSGKKPSTKKATKSISGKKTPTKKTVYKPKSAPKTKKAKGSRSNSRK